MCRNSKNSSFRTTQAERGRSGIHPFLRHSGEGRNPESQTLLRHSGRTKRSEGDPESRKNTTISRTSGSRIGACPGLRSGIRDDELFCFASRNPESQTLLRHSGRTKRSEGDPESRKTAPYRELLDPGSRPASQGLSGMTNCSASHSGIQNLRHHSVIPAEETVLCRNTKKTSFRTNECEAE